MAYVMLDSCTRPTGHTYASPLQLLQRDFDTSRWQVSGTVRLVRLDASTCTHVGCQDMTNAWQQTLIMSTKRRLLASTTVMVPLDWPMKMRLPVLSKTADAVTRLLPPPGLLLLPSPSAPTRA